MGFVAKDKIDRMSYDFTGLGPEDDDGNPTDIPGLEDAKGVTPEPSAAQIRRMKFLVRQIYVRNQADAEEDLKIAKRRQKAVEDGSEDDLIESRIREMSEDDFARDDEAWLDALAEATSGKPSREQIAALPFRVQAHFVSYMYEKLTNPQSASDDTKPSLAAVKSA